MKNWKHLVTLILQVSMQLLVNQVQFKQVIMSSLMDVSSHASNNAHRINQLPQRDLPGH